MSARTPILTSIEAKAFLTRADLEMLEEQARKAQLRAIVTDQPAPYLTVRGKYIQLFDVLQLLGTL